MPIYEYCCPGCQHRFELLRPLASAGESVACPRCRKPAKRAVSSFACFSRGVDGSSTPVAGGGSGCSSCSSSSCATCG
ncbi:MAG: zinc ribbon domain-containing protein [Dehalococcoidia bacterium]|nr:zinc ribbon domain-containing protein [Dehalococcoidia bacterium]